MNNPSPKTAEEIEKLAYEELKQANTIALLTADEHEEDLFVTAFYYGYKASQTDKDKRIKELEVHLNDYKGIARNWRLSATAAAIEIEHLKSRIAELEGQGTFTRRDMDEKAKEAALEFVEWCFINKSSLRNEVDISQEKMHLLLMHFNYSTGHY